MLWWKVIGEGIEEGEHRYREGRKEKWKHNRNACRRQRKRTISVLTGDKRHRHERMHTHGPRYA